MSINLSVELFKDGKDYGIYMSAENGSGIEVTGSTPEDAIENAKEYLLEYFEEVDE